MNLDEAIAIASVADMAPVEQLKEAYEYLEDNPSDYLAFTEYRPSKEQPMTNLQTAIEALDEALDKLWDNTDSDSQQGRWLTQASTALAALRSQPVTDLGVVEHLQAELKSARSANGILSDHLAALRSAGQAQPASPPIPTVEELERILLANYGTEPDNLTEGEMSECAYDSAQAIHALLTARLGGSQ